MLQRIFLDKLPEWFAAIGTISAVIVSLYLARRDRRIECLVHAYISISIRENIEECPKLLSIVVTNLGRRTFTLNSIGWQFGIFKKTHFAQYIHPNNQSSNLPIKLLDGEQAYYYFHYELLVENFKKILKHSPKYFLRTWLTFANINIHTSTNEKFKFKLHKSLRNEIALIKKIKKN